jgi:hypothetical protein
VYLCAGYRIWRYSTGFPLACTDERQESLKVRLVVVVVVIVVELLLQRTAHNCLARMRDLTPLGSSCAVVVSLERFHAFLLHSIGAAITIAMVRELFALPVRYVLRRAAELAKTYALIVSVRRF